VVDPLALRLGRIYDTQPGTIVVRAFLTNSRA
jgi:hypothetical protein